MLGIIFSCSLFIYSCKKSEISNPLQLGTPTPICGTEINVGNMVTSTIWGEVLLEDGSPMQNAMVFIQNESMQTDENGIFYFQNIKSPEHITVIKVVKDGYFDSYKTISVMKNTDNHVVMRALEKPDALTFNSSTGGQIKISNGGSVIFPADAIIDKNSLQPYKGEVRVIAKWINPIDENLNEIIPGGFRAIDKNGKENLLISYGMQGIELYGESNQPLQMAPNTKAEIHFPIPSSILSKATPEIQTWYFDENIGMWIEEGMAKLVANEYVANVSHFTFWNVDIGLSNLTTVEMTMLDQNNNPLSNAKIKLTATNNPSIFYPTYGFY